MYGGSATALLMAMGIAAPSFAATADATADATGASSATSVSEVIVTGTRQTGVTAADSAAPIQVVGEGALKRVGQPDLIQSLAQNLPSFNAEAVGGDTANLTLTAALRGLNPNDTLILVDGKRRHPTSNLHVDGSPYQGAATADLSFIPVSAIDHVEVLQDGAAAQYGSDAIAGVVNIILKSTSSGTVLTGTGGEYYEGDGLTGALSVNQGVNLGDKGYLNLTGEWRYHDFSQQGGIDRRVQTPNGSLLATLNPVDAAGVPNASRFPFVNKINGDAQFSIFNFFYNGAYDITDEVQFYSFGSYGHRTAASFENYRVPSKVIACSTLGAGPGGANGVTCPAGQSLLVPFPNGFDPEEALAEEDYGITGGFRGKVSGWNWDLGTTFGRDVDRISTIHSANRSLFIDSHFTPTDFFDGTFFATQWTTNLDFNRDFDVGMASPLNVAFGAEVRWERYSIGAGDAASIYKEGGQSFPGFQPTDAGSHTRTGYAGYIDVAGDPIQNLHVDLAGRYETYSDFGDTAVGKLTARYDFNPSFALRGTISTGFRAPTLDEEFYSATNVAPTFAVIQLPANSAAAAAAGFSRLKPESSTNFSIGFVAHPVDRLSITADGYVIYIDQRIVATGTLLGLVGTTVVSPGVLAAIAAHGNKIDPTVSYVGISVFTNAANTRTQGAEVVADYASDFGDWGHVDWSVGFNYNETAVTKQAPLPATVANPAFGQTTILGPTALGQLTTATPKEKVILGAFWQKDQWSVNLRETVYGPSSLIVSTDGTGAGANAVTEHINVTGITDLNVGYQLNKTIRFDMGANNLFNQRPPNVPPTPGGTRPADGANVYNVPVGFSPWGINGGYWYGKVTVTF
jgi:iron complex outermembrane receptor protein